MPIDRIINKLHISPTKAKILTNVLWAITGKIVTLLSTLVVGIFVARYLGPEQYGLMNYIISVVALFTVFATFGTTEIIIRELAKKDQPKDVILGSAFVVRLALAVVCLIAIGVYLFFSDETAETAIMIFIYASSIVFSCFDVIRFYFTSIVENEYVVKSEIFRTIDFVLLSSGYTLSYRRKVGSIRKWRVDKAVIKTMLSTSFPLLLSSAAMIIYQRIDQVMIGKMLDNEQLGYFSTAASFIGIATFIPSIMVQTVSPILIRKKKESEELYKTQSQKLMNITTWSTLLVSCFMSGFSYYIIRYTYGVEYLAAVTAMQILSFKAVGVALTVMGGQLIVIENIHQIAFIRNIMSCFVCVICNYSSLGYNRFGMGYDNNCNVYRRFL